MVARVKYLSTRLEEDVLARGAIIEVAGCGSARMGLPRFLPARVAAHFLSIALPSTDNAHHISCRFKIETSFAMIFRAYDSASSDETKISKSEISTTQHSIIVRRT
jgi:hypothetical protein